MESRVLSSARKLIITGKTAVGAERGRQGRGWGRKEAAQGSPAQSKRVVRDGAATVTDGESPESLRWAGEPKR